MSRFLLRSTLTAACVVALSASAAVAQSDTSNTLATAERSMPTMMASTPMASEIPVAGAPDPAFATRRSVQQVNPDVASVVRRESFGRAEVLMITGGALLLTGLIVDGDASSILIISGAGIGAYGLYLYLQSPNARFSR